MMPASRSPLDRLRTALAGLIALVAVAGWADVYLLRLIDHIVLRLLHRPLPPAVDGVLLLALTAWLGWGIVTLYASLPAKRGSGEAVRVKPLLRPSYLVAVAPVYWSVGLLIVRLTHDLAVALLHSVRG